MHSSPATATTSRRRATQHVPRVSAYSHASSISRVCGNRPRLYTYVLALLLCRLYTFWYSIFSPAQLLSLLRCISGFGVVRWCLNFNMELSVSAWYHKNRRVILRARCLLLLLLLAAETGGVRHKFQNFMQWSEIK